MLVCDKHLKYTRVSKKGDFAKVAEGGCSAYCGELLKCGHHCERLCHPLDLKHEEYECLRKCSK